MGYVPRRLLILPLMAVLAAAIFVLLPVVAVIQAIAVLGVAAGGRPRWRALRLWVFAAVYCRVNACPCWPACCCGWPARCRAGAIATGGVPVMSGC